MNCWQVREFIESVDNCSGHLWRLRIGSIAFNLSADGVLHACAAAQLLRHGIKLVQRMPVGVHCGSSELTACQTFSDFECGAASLARLSVFCDLLSIFKGELLLEEVFFRFVDGRLY